MTPCIVYFRAEDADAFAAAWRPLASHPDLDPIGPVTTTPAVFDPATGEETAPAIVDPRWHANLLVRSAAAAAAFEAGPAVLGAVAIAGGVENVLYGDPPAAPRRRFAGL